MLIFNLIIIVHELGHFLAARWRGLVVEEFGVWFGKPIWKKKINGVWYSPGFDPGGRLCEAAADGADGGDRGRNPRGHQEQLPPMSAAG